MLRKRCERDLRLIVAVGDNLDEFEWQSVFEPVKCSVDEDRKVSCLVRWQDPTSAANFVVTPSTCSYVVVASGNK